MKSVFSIASVTFLAGTLLSANLMANDQIRCTQPQWKGTPAINDQGNLEATLTSVCRLKSAGSIAQLNDSLLHFLTTENEVHHGPTDESYEGMPSKRFDLTNETVKGRDTITMRRDTHVASDQDSHLIYDFHSTKIEVEGKGDSKYLRSLSYRQEVSHDTHQETEEMQSFQLKVLQTVEIARPWYAPEREFLKRGPEAIKENFEKQLPEDAALVAKQLVGAEE